MTYRPIMITSFQIRMSLEPLGSLIKRSVRLQWGCSFRARRCLKAHASQWWLKFDIVMVKVFRPKYLREPTPVDTTRLMPLEQSRGFLGMVRSLDFMHRQMEELSICSTRKIPKPMQKVHHHFEAIATHVFWMWHFFFGMPESKNNINMLQLSPLFARLCAVEAHECNYTINDHAYNMGYYLCDGIYSPWVTFFKTIFKPRGNKKFTLAKGHKLLEMMWKGCLKCFKIVL